jgi:hypothetical protein
MRAAPGITSAAGYQAPPGRYQAPPGRRETGPDKSRPPGRACGRGHGERAILWLPSWSSG